MSKLWVIARKDTSEAFRGRSTYIFILIGVILTFSYVSRYNVAVRSLTNQQGVNDFSRTFLNDLAYVLPMMYSILMCSVFANYAVIVDKAKRNIESLMATPVSVIQIWIGKSLAVTLPSAVMGLSISVLAYLALNVGFVMPNTHAFIFPDALAIVSGLIVMPALLMSIVTIVIYVQLVIANPRLANLVFTGMFVLVVIGINGLGGLGVSIGLIPLVYLGLMAVCALVSLALSRSLTKEKVLLSSKG